MKIFIPLVLVGSMAALGGCSSSGGSTVETTGGTSAGTGGASASGGESSNGGMISSGGASSNGGVISSGGESSNGGMISSGGASSNGGMISSGGESTNGGASSNGGAGFNGGASSAGGRASGGASSTGGASLNGGASANGGRATGGASANGGTSAAGGSSAMGGATGKGGSTGTSPCSVTPVSPNSSQQAKNLLCYLYSEYGNHVLSGQQEANWNANPTDISWYNTNIGKYPAILGSDFLYRDGNSCTAVTSSTTRAIAYWNAGGLTMFRYHMGQPVSGSTCTNDCYTGTNCAESTPASGFFTNVITAGTGENTAFLNRLDYVAAQIGAMQAANVPIILALFHETQQNGWFWWSIGDTGAQFIALYTYAFNYLTKTKGLTNIIWLMPYSGSPNKAFFPGSTLVDISGGDTYGSNQPFTSLYSSCESFMGNTMPIALHETGLIPTPSAMFPTAAPWILFNIWAGYETSNNTVANIKSVYSDSHTVTRDLIPSLK
jgi:hypothetical protein